MAEVDACEKLGRCSCDITANNSASKTIIFAAAARIWLSIAGVKWCATESSGASQR